MLSSPLSPENPPKFLKAKGKKFGLFALSNSLE